MIWWLAALTGTAQAEVVDRLVAVVAAEPLLASQVRLDRDLADLDPAPVPFWRLPPAASEGDAIPADLQRSIDAVVLRDTASDVALYQPTREQVAERMAAIRVAFGDERWAELLAERGPDPTDGGSTLEAVVRRRMVVERFLLRNLQASPDDAAWTAECQAMVRALRDRTRIRIVDAMAPPDGSAP